MVAGLGMVGLGLALAAAAPGAEASLAAQEKPVPGDSVRVVLTGCARNRVFTVRWRDDHEPVTGEVDEGRRLRLAGPKGLLADIKAHQASMVQVTGLIRRSDLNPPRGIGIGAGGRVRIGGGQPVAPGAGVPAGGIGGGLAVASPPVIDLEGWMPLPDPCPSK